LKLEETLEKVKISDHDMSSSSFRIYRVKEGIRKILDD